MREWLRAITRKYSQQLWVLLGPVKEKHTSHDNSCYGYYFLYILLNFNIQVCLMNFFRISGLFYLTWYLFLRFGIVTCDCNLFIFITVFTYFIIPWFIHAFYCRDGFPRWHMVKNLPAKAGDARDAGLIPGLGMSNPLRMGRKWHPTSVFLPGKFHA